MTTDPTGAARLYRASARASEDECVSLPWAASACHDRGMVSVSSGPSTYRGLAERAWAWVLTKVKHVDEGLWLGEHPGETEPGDYPYGMHSGIGGLAHAIEEIRLPAR